MEIITELNFPATPQKDIWAVMGEVPQLKEWLSDEGFYLVPETIEKIKSGNEEHGDLWQLSHNKEGIQLTFEVAKEVAIDEYQRLYLRLVEERGNQLPLKSLSHDIQLHINPDSTDNSTIVYWRTDFEFKDVHSNRLKNWYLKRILEQELSVHIQELQEWSIRKLYAKVVKHNDIIANDDASDWWEREVFPEFQPAPEVQAA